MAACVAAAVLSGGCDRSPAARGVSTNVVVYADVHVPKGTSHYHATRLSVAIRDGIVTECRNEGVFDLFLGVPADEAERARRERLGR